MPNRSSTLSRAARTALSAALALGCAGVLAQAQEADLSEALVSQVREMASSARAAEGPARTRMQIEVGRLDPRLRLAPCEQVQPYLPAGFRAWGRTRVGLRCVRGPVAWNVYVPLQVKVFGPALVASHALSAGQRVTEGDLVQAEVDLAEDNSPALRDASAAVGRNLSRAVMAGASVRESFLRARQWFVAGETVSLVAQGAGFAVQGSGQAMSAGLEGASVRVRTESGRIVSGVAVGERRVEVPL
jgi:flagella basal body P-ring formation protein FlgA